MFRGKRQPPAEWFSLLDFHVVSVLSVSSHLFQKRKILGDSTSTQVLRDLEISLRTNHIEWVLFECNYGNMWTVHDTHFTILVSLLEEGVVKGDTLCCVELCPFAVPGFTGSWLSFWIWLSHDPWSVSTKHLCTPWKTFTNCVTLPFPPSLE